MLVPVYYFRQKYLEAKRRAEDRFAEEMIEIFKRTHPDVEIDENAIQMERQGVHRAT